MSDHLMEHTGTQRYDDAGVLIVDINCFNCDYNLRGLDRKGLCPECGSPVGESVVKFKNEPIPTHSEPPVEVVAGIVVISKMWFLSTVAIVLFVVATLLLALFNDVGPAVAGSIVLYLLSILLFLIGQVSGERRLGPKPKKDKKADDTEK